MLLFGTQLLSEEIGQLNHNRQKEFYASSAGSQRSVNSNSANIESTLVEEFR
jgi:hypothetical protein